MTWAGRRATVLGALAVALAASPVARAGCYYICSLAKEGVCIEHRSGCTSSGGYSRRGGGSVRYGAIAFSPSSSRYGYSDNYANRSQAASSALGRCGTSDCVIATWFYSSCGALAASTANHAWAGVQNNSVRRAAALALARCRQRGGVACQVLVSHCSG